MEQYIKKSDIVAEINKLKEHFVNKRDDFERGYHSGLNAVSDSLDSLEAKEVDLENSMVCKVDWYDGFLLDYTQEQQDELLEKIGVNVGDKIRVILIKE